MIKVLVCGGRDFGDLPQGPIGADRTHPLWEEREAEYWFVKKTLHDLAIEKGCYYVDEEAGADYFEGITIIHGGARGADRCADDWAIVNYIPLKEVKADWDTHGKKAGILRNIEMLKENPDIVIAFPGGKGTAHMIKIAKKAGVEVREIKYDKESFCKTLTLSEWSSGGSVQSDALGRSANT